MPWRVERPAERPSCSRSHPMLPSWRAVMSRTGAADGKANFNT